MITENEYEAAMTRIDQLFEQDILSKADAIELDDLVEFVTQYQKENPTEWVHEYETDDTIPF